MSAVIKHVENLLGENLRQRRKKDNLPLKALASDLGVSIATLSDWERGTRFPSKEHLYALSKILEIPVCKLFCPGTDLCLAEHGPCPHTESK